MYSLNSGHAAYGKISPFTYRAFHAEGDIPVPSLRNRQLPFPDFNEIYSNWCFLCKISKLPFLDSGLEKKTLNPAFRWVNGTWQSRVTIKPFVHARFRERLRPLHAGPHCIDITVWLRSYHCSHDVPSVVNLAVMMNDNSYTKRNIY